MPDLPLDPDQAISADAGGTAWIEVIRKMHETNADLLHYQVALSQKNTAPEDTQLSIVAHRPAIVGLAARTAVRIPAADIPELRCG